MDTYNGLQPILGLRIRSLIFYDEDAKQTYKYKDIHFADAGTTAVFSFPSIFHQMTKTRKRGADEHIGLWKMCFRPKHMYVLPFSFSRRRRKGRCFSLSLSYHHPVLLSFSYYYYLSHCLLAAAVSIWPLFSGKWTLNSLLWAFRPVLSFFCSHNSVSQYRLQLSTKHWWCIIIINNNNSRFPSYIVLVVAWRRNLMS